LVAVEEKLARRKVVSLIAREKQLNGRRLLDFK
jgi:hypothetical protein